MCGNCSIRMLSSKSEELVVPTRTPAPFEPVPCASRWCCAGPRMERVGDRHVVVVNLDGDVPDPAGVPVVTLMPT